jgi:phosphatidylglycerol:prolipoprotein diacylglycerol transferase
MYPILIRTPWLDLHTYGVLVAAGFLIGLAVAAHNAKREGLASDRIADLGLWLIVAGMAGGKLFHVVFFWNDFIAGWHADGIRSLREGFVFYGGFIGATVAASAFTRIKHLPFSKIADACAPGIALGHAFGRMGCFFNGCCYGKPCSLPWAVRFPPPHLMAGIPVHPTEIYEALGNVAIFLGLTVYYRRKRFDSQIWWLYVLSYGVLRFVIEFFRGDYGTYYLGVFTLGHAIAAIMVIIALVALARHVTPFSPQVDTSKRKSQ